MTSVFALPVWYYSRIMKRLSCLMTFVVFRSHMLPLSYEILFNFCLLTFRACAPPPLRALSGRTVKKDALFWLWEGAGPGLWCIQGGPDPGLRYHWPSLATCLHIAENDWAKGTYELTHFTAAVIRRGIPVDGRTRRTNTAPVCAHGVRTIWTISIKTAAGTKETHARARTIGQLTGGIVHAADRKHVSGSPFGPAMHKRTYGLYRRYLL